MNKHYLLIAGGALLLLSWMAKKAADSAAIGDGATADGEGGNSILDNLGAAYYGARNMIKGSHISPAGLAALEQREGLRLTVYNDTAGRPTIGYGHLIRAFENFDSGITQQQAADLLAADVGTAEDAVAALVSVPLTQDQFDALVSWTYNAGVGALKGSTLLKLLNAGDYEGARSQMASWIYVTRNGVKVVDNGLAARRASEMSQFA